MRETRLPASSIIKSFSIADEATCLNDAPTVIPGSGNADHRLLGALAGDAALLMSGGRRQGLPRDWARTMLVPEAYALGHVADNGVAFETLVPDVMSALADVAEVLSGLSNHGIVRRWLMRLRNPTWPDLTDSVLLAEAAMSRMSARPTR